MGFRPIIPPVTVVVTFEDLSSMVYITTSNNENYFSFIIFNMTDTLSKNINLTSRKKTTTGKINDEQKRAVQSYYH